MLSPSDGSGTAQPIATDFIDQVLFSPDGKLMSYNHLDTSQKQVGLQRAVVTFRDAKAVVSFPAQGRIGYQFTADGSALTYVQPQSAAAPATIFKVPLPGGAPQKLVEIPDSRVDVVRWAAEKTAIIAAFSLKNPVSNLWRWTAGSPKVVPLTNFPSGLIFEYARLARENDLLHARLEQPRHHQDYRSG